MKVTKQTRDIQHSREVSTVQVPGSDVLAYKAVETVNGRARECEGLATPDGILEYLEGGSPGMVAVSQHGQYVGNYMLVRPAYVEGLRDHGFIGPSDLGAYNTTLMIDRPFSALVAGEETVLVDVVHSTYMVYDAVGEPLPVCLHFGYIGTQMDNQHYDLHKAVEILLGRSDVHLLPHGGERSSPLVRDDKSYIGTIPPYNASRRRNQCIAFYWRPSVEDYRRVIEVVGKDNPSQEIKARTVLDLDILGLKAARLPEQDDSGEYDLDEYDADN